MTAPPIVANDAKTAGMWAFDRDVDWIKRYSACNNKSFILLIILIYYK